MVLDNSDFLGPYNQVRNPLFVADSPDVSAGVLRADYRHRPAILGVPLHSIWAVRPLPADYGGHLHLALPEDQLHRQRSTALLKESGQRSTERIVT